jgi:hypothetical protein
MVDDIQSQYNTEADKIKFTENIKMESTSEAKNETLPIIYDYYIKGQLGYRKWEVDGKCHNLDGPACIEYYPDGKLKSTQWQYKNILHRIGGPARIDYREDGTKQFEHWYFKGELDRIGEPAVFEYNQEGVVVKTKYFIRGVQVSPANQINVQPSNRPPEDMSDLPSYIVYIGRSGIIYSKNWITDSKKCDWTYRDPFERFHRLNGPARIFYYNTGEIYREEWYDRGRRHNPNGPAIIHYNKDGSITFKEHWLNGNDNCKIIHKI